MNEWKFLSNCIMTKRMCNMIKLLEICLDKYT